MCFEMKDSNITCVIIVIPGPDNTIRSHTCVKVKILHRYYSLRNWDRKLLSEGAANGCYGGNVHAQVLV